MLGDSGSPSCNELSIVDRVELGVPALEEEALVGDNDLARSKYQSAKSFIITSQ